MNSSSVVRRRLPGRSEIETTSITGHSAIATNESRTTWRRAVTGLGSDICELATAGEFASRKGAKAQRNANAGKR
jgi:hypothetical protein